MPIILKDEAVVSKLRARLLDWYDANGRALVWRTGARDPYRVWLSEVMLQQTTVPHATPYYEKFLKLWPTVRDLAAADDGRVMAEWAGLGYYARARKLLECARVVVRDHEGIFPADEVELLKLPGFGPYTAAAVSAIAFDQPANVVDGNIERIMTRLYAIETPMPKGKPEVREAAGQWVSANRPGDWPQALMDLATVICRPKSPVCADCPLNTGCLAHQQGDPARFPVKLAKAPKPRRYGIVYVMRTEDSVIVERRADKGLLGGMLGLPHSEWTTDRPGTSDASGWQVIGAYEHVFTHFALTQTVWQKQVDAVEVQSLLRANNSWQVLPLAEYKSLPTVFAKALTLKPQAVTPDLFTA